MAKTPSVIHRGYASQKKRPDSGGKNGVQAEKKKEKRRGGDRG